MAKQKHPAPFNRLRYNEDFGQYVAKTEHNGNKISLRFNADDPDTLQTLIPLAVRFWKSRVRWFKAFREYAASDLLTDLNDTLDSGQDGFKSVTAAQVRKLLPTPFSVEFTPSDDDIDDIQFEMAGGEDEELLDDCVFQVFGTLGDGITDGSVETMA